jgi:ribonuclease E
MATLVPDGEAGPQPLVPNTTAADGAPQGEFTGERQGGAPREGDEQGRRRRRRGRRGGRRRHGEGGPQDGAPHEGAPHDRAPHDGAPVAAPQGDAYRPQAPARPAIIGPGHVLPDEEPPFQPAPAPRSNAPRIEGPGDAHDWPWNRRNERFPDEPPAAAPLTPPSPFEATPDPVPRGETPQTAAAQPADPAPSDEPSGPPRKGWWKRLTS